MSEKPWLRSLEDSGGGRFLWAGCTLGSGRCADVTPGAVQDLLTNETRMFIENDRWANMYDWNIAKIYYNQTGEC